MQHWARWRAPSSWGRSASSPEPPWATRQGRRSPTRGGCDGPMRDIRRSGLRGSVPTNKRLGHRGEESRPGVLTRPALAALCRSETCSKHCRCRRHGRLTIHRDDEVPKVRCAFPRIRAHRSATDSPIRRPPYPKRAFGISSPAPSMRDNPSTGGQAAQTSAHR